MTNKEKVLGYYGAELFTEYTDNATFLMETCYTADDYDVFWCHPKDEMIPRIYITMLKTLLMHLKML